MSHSFVVLYFGGQCPWHPWVIDQARNAARQCQGSFDCINVERRPHTAAHYRLFFPCMTVIDDTIRVPAPLSADEMLLLARGTVQKFDRAATPINLQETPTTITSLTLDNISDTCSLCSPKGNGRGLQMKCQWAQKMATVVPGGIFGFGAYNDGQLKTAVEYLPASFVPYPLPDKNNKTAFITCMYPHDTTPNYRSHLLGRLLDYLPHRGFKRVQVISGRTRPRPNGPAPFLKSHGFTEIEILDTITTRTGPDELVLMGKTL